MDTPGTTRAARCRTIRWRQGYAAGVMAERHHTISASARAAVQQARAEAAEELLARTLVKLGRQTHFLGLVRHVQRMLRLV